MELSLPLHLCLRRRRERGEGVTNFKRIGACVCAGQTICTLALTEASGQIAKLERPVEDCDIIEAACCYRYVMRATIIYITPSDIQLADAISAFHFSGATLGGKEIHSPTHAVYSFNGISRGAPCIPRGLIIPRDVKMAKYSPRHYKSISECATVFCRLFPLAQKDAALAVVNDCGIRPHGGP